MCVLFFNLHYRVIFFPPMSSFYLACTGVFISSIKMLCFSDGFLQLLWIFSHRGVACCSVITGKAPCKTLFSSSEVGPQFSTLSFSSRVTSLSSLGFKKKESRICLLPVFFSFRLSLVLRGALAFPGQGTACGTVKDLTSDGSVSPFCGQVYLDKTPLLMILEESVVHSRLIEGERFWEVLRTF